jgi:hypothetical protein
MGKVSKDKNDKSKKVKKVTSGKKVNAFVLVDCHFWHAKADSMVLSFLRSSKPRKS